MINPLEHGLPHLVEVAIDPEMHPGATPDSEEQALVWAALDTTWKLLSEYSVRITLARIRAAAKEIGREVPPDEELFSQAGASMGVSFGYLALAVPDRSAADALEDVLRTLADGATDQAAAVIAEGMA